MFLKFINGTAKNNEQRLDTVNPTHLAMGSGKLVLQKNFEEVNDAIIVETPQNIVLSALREAAFTYLEIS